MEKLILRGVMWGADKIPDPWFEKVPGGYYKAKEEEYKQDKKDEKEADMQRRKSRRRARSNDRYNEDDGSSDRNNGYRSEGHGRQSDRRKSYDGPNDFDEINNRPPRQRSKPRPRRDDDDKYGYDDGYHRRRRRDDERSSLNGVEYGNGALPPQPVAAADPNSPYSVGSAVVAGAAGSPVAHSQSTYGSPPPNQIPYSPSMSSSQNGIPPVQSTSTLRGGIATGYVPYANIYGGPKNPQGPQNFAPPPSEIGSVQPSYMNQVAPPRVKQQNYQQNPYAQEAPPGAQPGYIPDPYANQRRDENQHGDYDSDTEMRSRRSRGHSRRDRSRSGDSYSDDSRHNDKPQRTRSERRSNGDDRGQRKVRHRDPRQQPPQQHARKQSNRMQPPPSRRKEEARVQDFNNARSARGEIPSD